MSTQRGEGGWPKRRHIKGGFVDQAKMRTKKLHVQVIPHTTYGIVSAQFLERPLFVYIWPVRTSQNFVNQIQAGGLRCTFWAGTLDHFWSWLWYVFTKVGLLSEVVETIIIYPNMNSYQLQVCLWVSWQSYENTGDCWTNLWEESQVRQHAHHSQTSCRCRTWWTRLLHAVKLSFILISIIDISWSNNNKYKIFQFE